MKKITLNFEIIGSYPVTFNVDDYLTEDDNWDEMTEDEKLDFIMDNFEDEAFHQAERDCEWSIGSLESIDLDNGSNVWIGN